MLQLWSTFAKCEVGKLHKKPVKRSWELSHHLLPFPPHFISLLSFSVSVISPPLFCIAFWDTTQTVIVHTIVFLSPGWMCYISKHDWYLAHIQFCLTLCQFSGWSYTEGMTVMRVCYRVSCISPLTALKRLWHLNTYALPPRHHHPGLHSSTWGLDATAAPLLAPHVHNH